MSGNGKKTVIQESPPRLPPIDWFEPLQLVATGIRVLISAAFGEHADARVMEVLDDQADRENPILDVAEKLELAPDAPLVIDYLADTGDGFDATFFMAQALDREYSSLKKRDGSTVPDSLGSSQVLLLGGDQVYPTASRDEYLNRLQYPFDAVPPRQDLPAKRLVFAIPGNHDWYDSLNSFSRLFCRRGAQEQERRKVGSWRTAQDRSYYSLRLPQGWWILGIDVQFGNDIDWPQLAYFKKVASTFANGDRLIILCAGPDWLKTTWKGPNDGEYRAARGLGAETNLEFFVRRLAKWTPPEAEVEISLYLSGDWHFYARHSARSAAGELLPPLDSPQLMITGGGGAFLHQNHWLESARNLRMPVRIRSGSERIGEARLAFQEFQVDPASAFPQFYESKVMAWKNLWLPFYCPPFALLMGLIYSGFYQLWAKSWHVIVATSGRQLEAPGRSLLEQAVRSALDIPILEHFKFDIVRSWGYQFLQGVASLATAIIYEPGMLLFVMGLTIVFYKARPHNGPRFVLFLLHGILHSVAISVLFFGIGGLQLTLWGLLKAAVQSKTLGQANQFLPWATLAFPFVIQVGAALSVGIPMAFYYLVDRQERTDEYYRLGFFGSARKIVGTLCAALCILFAAEAMLLFFERGGSSSGLGPEQVRLVLMVSSRMTVLALSYYVATYAFVAYLMLCSWLAPEYELLFSGLRDQGFKSFLRLVFSPDGGLDVTSLGFRYVGPGASETPVVLDSARFRPRNAS